MLIHTEICEGYEINFYAEPETDTPEGHFTSGDVQADAEICEKIRNGTYEWFVAKVTASKNGIVLGTDYLGGCCYESCEEFVTDNDYYSDMIKVVIGEAQLAIRNLKETA